MDNLSKILEKNDPKKQSQTEISLMPPVKESPRLTQSYLDRMLVIVSDSYESSAQNPTTAEKLSRAETWSRLLFDIIPEGRLQETFDRAFLAHDSSFPVSAYDLKDAWKEIAAQEKADQPTPTVKEIPIPVKYCVNRGRHTNDNGDVLDSLLDPPMELPCEFCRPIHRKERLQELEAQAVFEASAEC